MGIIASIVPGLAAGPLANVPIGGQLAAERTDRPTARR